MSAFVRKYFDIPSELAVKLTATASAQGKSQAAFVREAIEEKCTRASNPETPKRGKRSGK